MREIIFFETDFGNNPVEEFLPQLDSAPRAKVVRTLELVREQQIVPGKFWKKLSGTDLCEVGVEYASCELRFGEMQKRNKRGACAPQSV